MKKAENHPEHTKSAMPFEKALERLEQIVQTLETGDTSLDDSLALFEEGAALSQLCSRRLDEAEQKIRKITVESNGQDGE